MLKLSDLHSAYTSVTHEEAIAMANLGAQCWIAFKDGLYKQWSASMTAEDNERAESWRQEGRLSAMETLKARMASAETAMAQLATAEGRLTALRESMEAETNRRVAEALESKLKDVLKDAEMNKLRELSEYKERLAKLEGREELVALIQNSNVTMKTVIESQTSQLEAIKEATAKATTKSSHAIGKQGEASILELLEGPIMTAFPYSSVKNMSGVSYAADFHLWIMTEAGTRKKFLIDSKKYARPVDSKEVAKLNRDVDADDESHGGILISIGSTICAKKQFQIQPTPKHKPIVYLTFVELTQTQQKDLLCWGIQTLVALVGESKTDMRDKMLLGIETFLEGINSSVKDLDKAISCQVKAVEAIRQVRAGILNKIITFKSGDEINTTKTDETESVFQIEEVDITTSSNPSPPPIHQVDDGGCITLMRTTGIRCGKPVNKGQVKCRHHLGTAGRKQVGNKAKKYQVDADDSC